MSQLPPDDPARDPRSGPSDGATGYDSGGALRPAVAGRAASSGLGLIIGGSVFLGLLAFVFLSTHRTAPKAVPVAYGATADIAPAPPPPPEIAATEAAARGPAPAAAQAVLTPPTVPSAAVTITPPVAPPAQFAIDTAALGRKSPTLVVDLGESPPAVAAGTEATTTSGSAARKTASGTGGANGSGLNTDEQFAERVGASEPERSRATIIRNTRETIPQGAMIPGVLETALNSDLPGFARAVVSRDVRGFDGSTVLIPRGSRVIGQYKSAVAQGQSRAFVIWTRIIRPDGASIQIASSGTDPLGRAGLEGSVDRHFFERFGGAILLSVIDAGVASLARAPSTQVVIGSSTDATNLGASAITPTTISPTIKVPQGAPIRIFVARDLDFSPVGAAR